MNLDETYRITEEQGRTLCAANGYSMFRMFAHGGNACIAPFIFTWAIITDITRFGYESRWCYESYAQAVIALNAWDGADDTEPQGWHRHPDTGRRRPDGDASKEYVNR